jgi:hypothetical protein
MGFFDDDDKNKNRNRNSWGQTEADKKVEEGILWMVCEIGSAVKHLCIFLAFLIRQSYICVRNFKSYSKIVKYVWIPILVVVELIALKVSLDLVSIPWMGVYAFIPMVIGFIVVSAICGYLNKPESFKDNFVRAIEDLELKDFLKVNSYKEFENKAEIVVRSVLTSNELEKQKHRFEHALGKEVLLVGAGIDRNTVKFIFRLGNVESKKASEIIRTDMLRFVKDSVIINNSLVWNFREAPHALITGITKGGKTYFLSYMILCFAKAKAVLKIIDPKKSDLSYLENYFGSENVVTGDWQIARILREALEEMERRYSEFKTFSNYAFGKDYSDYGYQPYIIVFDEVMAFMGGSAEDKLKKEVNNRLLEIIAKGRQAGVYMILTTQRADAKYIDTAMRDQLGLRVALGRLSETGYSMTFGEEYKKLKLKDINKGAGYVFVDGLTLEPQEFVSPFLDFDFISELESIVGKKFVDLNKDQEAQ